MTASPFSNVIGNEPNDSTFVNVESTQDGDTTDSDRSVPGQDSDGAESTLGVITDPSSGATHVAEQGETAGQTDTGASSPA